MVKIVKEFLIIIYLRAVEIHHLSYDYDLIYLDFDQPWTIVNLSFFPQPLVATAQQVQLLVATVDFAQFPTGP